LSEFVDQWSEKYNVPIQEGNLGRESLVNNRVTGEFETNNQYFLRHGATLSRAGVDASCACFVLASKGRREYRVAHN
jgi:hypothetical protein